MEHNTTRGVLPSQNELTKRKLQLQSLNPDVDIEFHNCDLGNKNHLSNFTSKLRPRKRKSKSSINFNDDNPPPKNVDLILCCVSENNAPAKKFINETCIHLGVDWFEVWTEEQFGSLGYIRYYIPGEHPCLLVFLKKQCIF